MYVIFSFFNQAQFRGEEYGLAYVSNILLPN